MSVEEAAYTRFWWNNLRERDHLGDRGVVERIILSWIFRKWDMGHGLDRTGSGYGEALVNAVMNLRVP
jgi:hypothetical protein